MIKKLPFLICFLSTLGTLSAQNIDGLLNTAEPKAQAADKALMSFTLDYSQLEKLHEAWNHAKAVVNALKEISLQQLEGTYPAGNELEQAKRRLSKIWTQVGNTYREIAQQRMAKEQLGFSTDGLPEENDSAYLAAFAYQKAVEVAADASQIKKAVDGLSSIQSPLYSDGVRASEREKDYLKAYLNFNAMLIAHELIKAHQGNSLLNTEAALHDHWYLTAITAYNAKGISEAAKLFQKLVDVNYSNPIVYAYLYEISDETDSEKAYTYLKKGRQLFPEDTNLRFTEINYYLSQNRVPELIELLEQAIQKEPNTLELYTTLGSVYETLFQHEFNAGNRAQSEAFFNQSVTSFKQALQKDPEFLPANYGIGTLYYNHAAMISSQLGPLHNDFSREGQKKYEEVKAQMLQNSDHALPYLIRCEKAIPNDINLLIALKEIYLIKENIKLHNEFKARFDKAQNGGVNNSYFLTH